MPPVYSIDGARRRKSEENTRAMMVIPVLDVMGGCVVRGIAGDRARYRPITSSLSASAEPLDVAEGLLSLFPFRAMYLADLDAIGGGAPDHELYERLRAAHPGTRLWIDCGITSAEAAGRIAAAGHVPVAGTETLEEASFLAEPEWRSQGVLSLDHGPEGVRGDRALFASAADWPDRVIAMTLARVGAGTGPDLEMLRMMKKLGGDRDIYAAGGVRGTADLAALETAGAAGVLVASALHDGRVTGADLAALDRGEDPRV